MSQIQKLLLEKINNNQKLINDWFEAKFSTNKPIFYNSVDLRHSGFKIAPVDNNCFPAGWNNLNLNSRKLAKEILHDFLNKNYPDAKKILLIPENHTRNIKYLENIFSLKNILKSDGRFEVVLGSLISEVDDELVIDLEKDHKITLHGLLRKGDKIVTKSNFVPDLIITNNDFTHIPEAILENISQKIIPSTSLGWHSRTKSKHFNIYQKLATELAALIGIDPWFIDSIHQTCQNLDFKNKSNVSDLANLVDEVINKTKDKYQQYGINSKPYCFVKADSGTYGMGIMTVESGEEILHINKKQRNKMNMIKGNVVNHQVIIQEGITTIDKVSNITAEPLIYLMNGKVVGNLTRVNEQRDENISLNTAGMQFKDMDDLLDKELEIGGKKEDVFKIYELIARLSTLAVAFE